MKPLFVLAAVFLLALLVGRCLTSTFNLSLAARIAMCAMLFFTAIGHFVFTKGMTMMIPEVIPFKTLLVYITGILEVLLGVALLVPGARVYAGCALVVLFVLLLPANVYAAFVRLNYEKGTFDGPGMTYLWFRIPLQVLFILWTYLSSIKEG